MSEQKRNPLVTLVKKSVGLPVGPSSCCAVPAGLTPAGDPAAESPEAQAKDESAAGCCGEAAGSNQVAAGGATVEVQTAAGCCGAEAEAEPSAQGGCCG